MTTYEFNQKLTEHKIIKRLLYIMLALEILLLLGLLYYIYEQTINGGVQFTIWLLKDMSRSL